MTTRNERGNIELPTSKDGVCVSHFNKKKFFSGDLFYFIFVQSARPSPPFRAVGARPAGGPLPPALRRGALRTEPAFSDTQRVK